MKRSTVSDIILRNKNEDRIELRKQTGHRKVLTDREESLIIRQIKKNPRVSAPKLASEIESATGKKVHAQTIRRAIHKRGYNGRIAPKKPYVCERNRHKRLQFAKEYENKGEDWWEKALFSDESKFNVFGSDSRQMVWRKPEEKMNTKNLRPTVKHGGGNEGSIKDYFFQSVLKARLQEEWEKIPIDITKKIVHSMPCRLKEVIKQKGGPTRY
ncbi:hypothetical protein ANN_20212 [Periplaneta americana]|uniref:Transposase Tc1-like domain-containing protein n=1 Tax=Periplaneta americana TaxID=6978 RepID=A0ABQ8SCA0_PERAM|nr:hypothetical protein ANN_20212 [Periplaneta americana]